MSNYSYYKCGLKVGDCIVYNIVSPRGWIFDFKENTGIIVYRKYLFSNDTRWGERKFFNYKIYNNTNRLITLDTRYIKIIKYIGNNF